ncbi:MAG: hypothetical protein MUP44_08235, partial [Anaerolineales bacterium]|nr:hypothetical protein [Anaerolineales bacterium]
MPEKRPSIDAAWIKRRALQLGFSLVGITTADPPPHLDAYRDWVKTDRHAGMAYLAREDAIAKR